MKRFLPAFLFLILALIACSRSARNSDSVSVTTRTLTIDGEERTYLLYVPPSYDGDKDVPLVISMHGGVGNGEIQMQTSGFNSIADTKGFIVAYPNGGGRLEDKIFTWNAGSCCGYSASHNMDDVAFIRALVADVQSNYRIDEKRIYASGMSNGGMMSYRLGCDASDLFAAIASVSGTLNYPECDPQYPISIIHFHGTADRNVLYDGGYGPDALAKVNFTSVHDTISFWLRFDQCSEPPQSESFADIKHEAYSCANQTDVELYTIIGGKHAWPGSQNPSWFGANKPTQTISASDLIWEFFDSHPKP